MARGTLLVALLIRFLFQTTNTVLGEQALKVTSARKGSTPINSQKIESPRTDKAGNIIGAHRNQPGKESASASSEARKATARCKRAGCDC
jgi:hypothetical protein